jgi:hypothetical protein
MKFFIHLCIFIFCPFFVQGQVSIEEFRKLETRMTKLETENESLKGEVFSLKNKLNETSRLSKNRAASAKKQISDKTTHTESEIENLKASIAQLEEELEETESEFIDVILEICLAFEEVTDNNISPIGMISPYHGELSDLPDNWILCNGQKVTDNESPFHDKNVPDLNGFFIRGKTIFQKNGSEGGSNYTPPHNHDLPTHNHEVGDHTHGFVTNSSHGGYRQDIIRYSHIERMRTIGSATISHHDQKVVYFDESGDYALGHRHSGTTQNASTGYTKYNSQQESSSEGGHSNVPKYKAFNYIIKIK